MCRGGSKGANPAMAPIHFCQGQNNSGGKQFFSLNFSNFCDYFVKKVVSEIKNAISFRGSSSSDPHYMLAKTWSHPTCSLNFSKLCDNFVKKLVSEIRKCRHLQRD